MTGIASTQRLSGVGAVALAIVVVGSNLLAACAPGGQAAPKETPVPAVSGPKPVSVEGSVVPLAQAKLAFQAAGRVTAVGKAGQTVKAGDVLAQLDTADLRAALKGSQDDLEVAQAQEAQAREGQARAASLPEQLNAAAAAVRASRSKVADLAGGPREADRRAAESGVEQAAARLADASAKRDQLLSQPKQADVEAAKSALEKAQRDAEAAQARLALLERGPSEEDVASAQSAVDRATADVTSARAALTLLQRGASAQDVTAAQVTLDQAKTRLSQLNDAPRATPQDIANAKLAVEQAQVGLDKALADGSNGSLVGDGKAVTRAQADAAIKQAQIQLAQAQNSYDKLVASAPSDWDIRLAQEGVASAQAAYDRVVKPASAEDVARTQAQVTAAEAGLAGAQAKLQQVQRGAEEADRVAARGTLAAAVAGVAAAQTRLDQVVAGPTGDEQRAADAAVAAAQADLRGAQAKLDQLLAGATAAEKDQADSTLAGAQASDAQARRAPDETGLQVAVARTKRAATAVEQAQLGLDRATLRAPFDGVITKVDVREGEYATLGATAVTVADLTVLQIETRDLDESAAARVRDGQEVSVIVTALGRRALAGRVTDIARQPTINASGDVFYTATITLAQPDPDLRWGMTVKVEFK